MSTNFQVDLKQLIEFYDSDVRMRPHAASIKSVFGEELGLALLIHSLRSNGYVVEPLPIPCTGGSRGSKRLDAWLSIDGALGPHYCQVEVKSWSIHGVGGIKTPIGLDATPDELRVRRTRQWKHYWDPENKRFLSARLAKVTDRMKAPGGGLPVIAVACLWDLVHSDERADAMFEIDPPEGAAHLKWIWVFSGSTYVRSLINCGVAVLDLELPKTAARVNALHRVLGLRDHPAAPKRSVT